MRIRFSFTIDDPAFSAKLSAWIGSFSRCIILDSNSQHYPYDQSRSRFDQLFAAGLVAELTATDTESPFEKLKDFLNQQADWCFGHFNYDLKNATEKLSSSHPDFIGFPALSFFIPEILILKNDSGYEALMHQSSAIRSYQDILDAINAHANSRASLPVPLIQSILPDSFEHLIQPRIQEEEYLRAVRSIQHHITQGDIYEANFCMEFYGECLKIEPWGLFQELIQRSPTPFSAFYRLQDRYLLSASPERFLYKQGQTIVSQPIKGTIRRSQDPDLDELLKEQLTNNPKERAENIMIVDLVRNDLARTASRGTVHVEELCAPYTFPLVHHLISTVVSELQDTIHPVDAIRAAFPMGSMTGAPKIRAMELLEQYESTKRGLYSGSLGYFTPDLDFDFNVVIRSFSYHAENHYLNWMTGGAITTLSSPEEEYKECLLKASGMEKALQAHLSSHLIKPKV